MNDTPAKKQAAKKPSAKKTGTKKREVSAEQRAAMTSGRTEAITVRNYLDALERTRPRRGRRRTRETAEKQLAETLDALETATSITRLGLVQRRNDLEEEIAAFDSVEDITELEESFTKIAASYGERKGIKYDAWRELGVPANVLKEAGIPRS